MVKTLNLNIYSTKGPEIKLNAERNYWVNYSGKWHKSRIRNEYPGMRHLQHKQAWPGF